MKTDFSFQYLRRSKIAQALDTCDSDSRKIDILLDKVVELQDCLIELQQNYMELLLKSKSFTCVQTQF